MSEAINDIDDYARRILPRLERPVVFIGLMGAGKTRIGRALAEALSLVFVDSDDEVEKAAGMRIADIFECYGESVFRDTEARVLRRLIGEGVQIIATGGGAVMNPETADIIWQDAVSVWLRADIPVIVERTARTDKRPLLRVENPAEILQDLSARRAPVYKKADLVIDSGNEDADRVLLRVLKALDDYLMRE